MLIWSAILPASSSEVFCLCLRKYKNIQWLDLLTIKRILSEDKTSVLLRLSYLNLQHKGQIEKYLLQKSLNQDVPKIFLYITIHILGEVFVVTPSTWFLTRYKKSGRILHIYIYLFFMLPQCWCSWCSQVNFQKNLKIFYKSLPTFAECLLLWTIDLCSYMKIVYVYVFSFK